MAGLVTAAAFAVPAWLCGALLLPSLLEDPAIRWSLACALGAVLGSLAVLWSNSFATSAPASGTSGSSVEATAERAVAIGGSSSGPISTGDTTAPAAPAPTGPAPVRPGGGPDPDPPPAAGTVSASGTRSIAMGGTNSGPLSTGDQRIGEQAAGDPPDRTAP
ncbi:hypothetical protein OHT20_05540 [Streptomyces caniferus]|uniref:Uncharacterized protein n=1 Tax=Streptomyces caniferus TaxID=285557 RepID=A0ABZ1VG06_9ACTN|nr:hypothetical protein [Streptomyces caniferus]